MVKTIFTKKNSFKLFATAIALSATLSASGHYDAEIITSGLGWAHGIACDSSDNLYVTGWVGNDVLKITFDRDNKAAVSTFATPHDRWNSLSGSYFNNKDGCLYVASVNDAKVFKVKSDGSTLNR